jgi:hypothetical protein
MRNEILTIGLMLGLGSAHGHAQGTVNFVNSSATAVTNALTGARLTAGTTFLVGLYYMPDQAVAPTVEEMMANAIPLGATTIIQPAAGLFWGGTRVTPSTTPPLDYAWFQVRIWEAAFGTTFEQALNNFHSAGSQLPLFGASNIMRGQTGGFPDTGPGFPPPALNSYGLEPFQVGSIQAIPEPTSLGMACLGLGALFLFRRRS